jgi:diguanylate cyclase (GGDEF)-like protein
MLQTLKGWTFVMITAALLYVMMHMALRTLRLSEQALYQSYSELEATHEELVATEEELKQQFDEIQERENYYRGIYEGISSGLLVYDRSGMLIQSNDSALHLLRLDRNISLYRINGKGLHYSELIDYLVQEESMNRSILIEVITPQEEASWILAQSDYFVNERTKKTEVITTLVDHTLETKLDIYSEILREMNEAVLKGTPSVRVEQLLCDRLCAQSDFAMVWIGLKNPDGSVTLSSSAGMEGADSLIIRWDDSIYGQGSVGRCIRLGVPQCFAVERNAIFSAWSEFFEPSQIQSVAAFPLIHDGEVFGAVSLYSYSLDFFKPKLMVFFEHFATQLALLFSQAKAQEQLKENEARYRGIMEHMSNAVTVFEASKDGEDFIIKEFNSAAERTELIPREEVLEKSLVAAFPYAEPLGLVKALKRVWQTGSSEQFSSYYEEGNLKFWRENSLYKLPDGELVSIYRDITHRKRIEEQMWRQAHHDTLTDLPNRLLFNEHLNTALAQAKRRQSKCAILFLDLDRFKLINDTLGHNSGDLLLQYVAQRLRHGLYEGDTIGRLGGDEFLILLPVLEHEEQAATVAEKILSLFTEPFQLDSNEVFISPSIGISLYPTDGQDIDTLIQNADAAMYHAKEKGRNNFQFFTQALNDKIHERLMVENSLRKALEQKEFLFHYQPIVNLDSGRPVGVETLIRWQSPQRGLVSPGVFIPIAEETGLIIPIGKIVLYQACRQNMDWQQKGYAPQRVAVNISPRQFREPDFVETVISVLQETGMDPHWLELEITEGIAMDQGEHTINQLNRLKELGIQISIDDFGTGFSSLNSLRHLPLNTLKIDQIFMQEIGNDSNGEAVLRSIIHLAKDLSLKIIAEGVETEEQLDFLKKECCEEMQGFLFSRPLPAEEFEERYLARRGS